jgi:hypothetical protein
MPSTVGIQSEPTTEYPGFAASSAKNINVVAVVVLAAADIGSNLNFFQAINYKKKSPPKACPAVFFMRFT